MLVSAPDARITVNDVVVGEGQFLADTLKPGDYRISASVPDSPEGCETARVDSLVRLRPGSASREIRLAPKGCGMVQVQSPETGAHWTLSAKLGNYRRDGDLPLTASIVVPAGDYLFTAGKPRCTSYTDTSVVVSPGRTSTVSFTRLVCPLP
jgi:hypothetical protein